MDYKKKYLKYKKKYLSLKGGSSIKKNEDLCKCYTSKKKNFLDERENILNELKNSSKWTYDHSKRVSELCKIISKNLGYDTYLFEEAGLFHDLGKMCINHDILNSSTDTRGDNISKEQKDNIINELKLHPKYTKLILDKYNFPFYYSCKYTFNRKNNHDPKINHDFPTICADHHEKLDGKGGYGFNDKPKLEKDICFITQVVTVSDIYDSLRSARPYKPSFNHENTIKIMKKMTGIKQIYVNILEKKNPMKNLDIYNKNDKLIT